MILTQPCGCRNRRDSCTGVLLSVSKCEYHFAAYRAPSELGEQYFEELGVMRDGKRVPSMHVAEMREAIGQFPQCEGRRVLEIGCGISPYVTEFDGEYIAVEPSSWAAQWMREQHGVRVIEARFDDAEIDGLFDVIVAAHCLEHIDNPLRSLYRMRGLLRDGGQLFLLVPEGTDLVNPDHLAFFTETTLKNCVRTAGLFVDTCAVKQIVPRERFIYLRASV